MIYYLQMLIINEYRCESMRDAHINDEGIEQCKAKQDTFNSIDVHTVFISPLRRAMQTTYYTFKEHPNLENIKFVVVPGCREFMNLASGIPSNIEETVKSFDGMLPNIDMSMFDHLEDKLHYFLYDTDPNIKEEMLQKLTEKDGDCIGSNAFDLLVEKSFSVKPKKLESNLNMLKRVNKVKAYVREYVKQLEDGQKVVIVSHFHFLRTWTGKWNNNSYNEETDDLRRPDIILNFQNTHAFYDKVEFSEWDELHVEQEKAKNVKSDV
jgi:broad specificity phosphatase PhoE